MARYLGPACKLCRAEGIKLFLKGKKCLSAKCPINDRNFPPGMHGRKRTGKLSDYGIQLREKQKAKRIYGILERQFRRYYQAAERRHGVTGDNLLQLLESRLDSVIYRMGFANSRCQARQIIRHNHVLVNGIRVNIPSYHVRLHDQVEINEKSRNIPLITEALQLRRSAGGYEWMNVNMKELSGSMTRLPTVEEIAIPVKEQLIIELYSK